MNISVVEVHISVAVSDCGQVQCCIANSGYIKEQSAYKDWVESKRTDKAFWSIKTVKLNVPAAFQYEDLTKEDIK